MILLLILLIIGALLCNFSMIMLAKYSPKNKNDIIFSLLIGASLTAVFILIDIYTTKGDIALLGWGSFLSFIGVMLLATSKDRTSQLSGASLCFMTIGLTAYYLYMIFFYQI